MVALTTLRVARPRPMSAVGGDGGFIETSALGHLIVTQAADASAPGMLVRALKDPLEAPLERLQIVKGWVDGLVLGPWYVERP